MPLTVLLQLLEKNCPHGKVRAVSLNTEREVVVKEEEDRLGGDGSFESVEDVLLQCFSTPCAVLDGEVKQRTCMVREVLNEPLVEVGEA